MTFYGESFKEGGNVISRDRWKKNQGEKEFLPQFPAMPPD